MSDGISDAYRAHDDWEEYKKQKDVSMAEFLLLGGAPIKQMTTEQLLVRLAEKSPDFRVENYLNYSWDHKKQYREYQVTAAGYDMREFFKGEVLVELLQDALIFVEWSHTEPAKIIINSYNK